MRKIGDFQSLPSAISFYEQQTAKAEGKKTLFGKKSYVIEVLDHNGTKSYNVVEKMSFLGRLISLFSGNGWGYTDKTVSKSLLRAELQGNLGESALPKSIKKVGRSSRGTFVQGLERLGKKLGLDTNAAVDTYAAQSKVAMRHKALRPKEFK